jgi:simple sugar transport system substrate-binding protein
MRGKRIITLALTAMMTAAMLAGCSGTGSAKTGAAKKLVIGFAQVGAESGWRTAETASIKDMPNVYPNIDLKFSDAQQKQENQLKAVRAFIAEKVDIIAIDPVVETGWDTVLKEAQTAKIPVIIVDRSVNSSASMYAAFLGSDMELEGQRAAQIFIDHFGKDKAANIVEIQGTTGSSAQTGRDKGFNETIKDYTNIKIVKVADGDFVRATGKQVMEAFLKADPNKTINGLWSENDDMGVGAIQAITEAGRVPGKDIFIVSVDGIKDMFALMAQGQSNGIVECNPLLGPQLGQLAQDIVYGKSYDKVTKSSEKVFLQDQAAAELPNRKY